MNILIAVEELRIGGAQTFALRLAQALKQAGHQVYLYNMYWQFTEFDLVKRLAPDVELLQYQPSLKKLDTFKMRAEGWLQRRGKRVELRAGVLQKHLAKVLHEKKIQVVHSHTFKCDYLMAKTLQSFPAIRFVVTMHGDYEQFLAFFRLGTQYVIPGFLHKLTDILTRVNGIAYLSEQNLEVLRPSVTASSTAHIQLRCIYNGLDAHFSDHYNQFTRANLGISGNALVFGMVARGVAEKGWEPLIRAYQRVKANETRPVHLVLVGSSDFLSELSKRYSSDSAIHFLGFANNPVDSIDSFDIGILASSLRESLPNSIAEYLFCGKPVVSTSIGEIQRMITTEDGQEAGLLIDFPEQGLADEQQLYEAMNRYATNKHLLLRHQQLAKQAFVKFDMTRCIESYTELYLAR